MASRNIVVLGGGISGLSTAWFLRAGILHASKVFPGTIPPVKISILEQKQEVGGWFSTAGRTSALTKGFLLEQGPHSFRPRGDNGKRILGLVQELGLQQELIGTSSKSSARYIWTNEHSMEKLPSSLVELFTSRISRSLPWLAIPEMLMLRPRMPPNDETVHDFFQRRFSTEVAETLASAMVSGIYAGDPKQLSLRSCFKLMWDLEYNYGSIVGGMLASPIVDKIQNRGQDPHKSLLSFVGNDVLNDSVREYTSRSGVSFSNGMQVLSETIRDKLLSGSSKQVSVEIVTGAKVTQLHQNGNIDYNTESGDRVAIEADHVFSTIPSTALQSAIPNSAHAVRESIDSLCNSLPTVDVAVVNVAYAKSELPVLELNGFGHLVPYASQDDGVLGVIYDSCVFPAQAPFEELDASPASTWLTVMLGGARSGERIKSLQETELIAIAQEHLEKTIGISKSIKPSVALAVVHGGCIPQYGVGHPDKVESLRNALAIEYPHVTLAGNHFGGVGITDCVGNAALHAEHYINKLCGNDTVEDVVPSRGRKVVR